MLSDGPQQDVARAVLNSESRNGSNSNQDMVNDVPQGSRSECPSSTRGPFYSANHGNVYPVSNETWGPILLSTHRVKEWRLFGRCPIEDSRVLLSHLLSQYYVVWQRQKFRVHNGNP